MEIAYFAHTIIFNEEKEILIIKRSAQEDVYPNLWDLPGGQVEKGESPLQGALREIHEEIGLNITKAVFLAEDFNINEQENRKYIRQAFVADYAGGEVVLNPRDHSEFKWIKVSEMGNYNFIKHFSYLQKTLEAYINK